MFKKTLLTVSFLTVLTIFISSGRLLSPSRELAQQDSDQIVSPLLPTAEEAYCGFVLAEIPQPEPKKVVKPLGRRSISTYDDMMRRAAAESGHDWRLLSAIAFHESRFNPDAVSKVGAFGLMQIMPRVAEQFNVPQEEAFDPETNIRLASKLLNKIDRSLRLSAEATEEDRLCLMLASYVGGIGHVRDAQRLAAKYSENPEKWEVVSRYLELKGQPEYYEDSVVRCGRFTGIKQTLAYVRNVKSHYDKYCEQTL
ncbi:MAG: transglycosylase SLT domain-containing protein [Rikenellaceae bacterium]|jgi:membrane-bound lytic murein transglycosylase F|nr:transglycosylase SLT domain-containing protein [Rikenellaceae bacterium]MBQ5372408.1 transglycosylase SLT domain-containing protein [Rikenellaceae bacterium]MBQ5596822.1 transglycosylase SLT domain-containing protein [Rikenellaceae bacterium]MBQ5894262.1 transglycosylase SLT domain-containing protein [Rikenellaceae bacterium]